jgi:hypothetical protein
MISHIKNFCGIFLWMKIQKFLAKKNYFLKDQKLISYWTKKNNPLLDEKNN